VIQIRPGRAENRLIANTIHQPCGKLVENLKKQRLPGCFLSQRLRLHRARMAVQRLCHIATNDLRGWQYRGGYGGLELWECLNVTVFSHTVARRTHLDGCVSPLPMGFIALPEEQAEPIKAAFDLRTRSTVQKPFVKRALNPIEQLSGEYYASTRTLPVRSAQRSLREGDGEVQLRENRIKWDALRMRGRGHGGFSNVLMPGVHNVLAV
jgi:hypothetical protein